MWRKSSRGRGGAKRGHDFFGNQYTKVAKYSRSKRKAFRKKTRGKAHLYRARALSGASTALTAGSLAVSTSVVGVGVGIGLGVGSAILDKRARINYGRHMNTKAGKRFKPLGSTRKSRMKTRSLGRKRKHKLF